MKFGGPDLVVTYNSVDVTQHIEGDIEIALEALFADSKPFGESQNQSIPTGDINIPDFGWEGLYDEDANAPKQLWDLAHIGAQTPSSTPKNIVITHGTPSGTPADAITIPVFVKKFDVVDKRNDVHRYKVMFTKGPGDITRT